MSGPLWWLTISHSSLASNRSDATHRVALSGTPAGAGPIPYAGMAAANALARDLPDPPRPRKRIRNDMAFSSSFLGREHRLLFELSRLLAAQLAFPLGDHRGSDAVAEHVGGRAPHVEKLVDAQDEQQPRPGKVERRQRGREHHH